MLVHTRQGLHVLLNRCLQQTPGPMCKDPSDALLQPLEYAAVWDVGLKLCPWSVMVPSQLLLADPGAYLRGACCQPNCHPLAACGYQQPLADVATELATGAIVAPSTWRLECAAADFMQSARVPAPHACVRVFGTHRSLWHQANSGQTSSPHV